MPETPIKDSLEEIMKKTPATGRGFSETLLTLDGWQTELGHKINPNWKVGAFAGGKWKGKPQAGVLIKGQW